MVEEQQHEKILWFFLSLDKKKKRLVRVEIHFMEIGVEIHL